MIIIKQFLFSCLLLGLSINVSFGCNCFPVRQLNVENWNDADLVFTGTLTQQKVGRVGMLSFKTTKVYKGKVDTLVTFYFQPGKSHTLLHAVKKVNIGDEWVVFARKKKVGKKIYYRLKDSPSKRRCALSRPIQEEKLKDPYLKFIETRTKESEGFQKIVNDKNEVIAEGNYLNQCPVDQWKYLKPRRKTSLVGNYKNGQREGEWIESQEKRPGRIQKIRTTIYNNGDPIEIHDYSHTGKISLKKTLSDSMEIRHYYRNDGSLKSATKNHFENDSTYVIIYFENEKIKEERFLKGKKVMQRFWYDEEGILEKVWERNQKLPK